MKNWQEYSAKKWERLDRLIARKFQHSHMSNTKWRKFFVALVSFDSQVLHANFKFVDDEKIWHTHLPFAGELNEEYVDGSVGAFSYKEIEWIEIPAQVALPVPRGLQRPPQIIEQDLSQIAKVLNNAGQFPIEFTEKGLLIRAYS